MVGALLSVTAFLKRIPTTVYVGALACAVGTGGVYAASNWYQHRLAREFAAGVASVHVAASITTLQYQADTARLQQALRDTRDSARKIAHIAELHARSSVATGRLIAAQAALSAPAKADTTVKVLEAASVAVSAENDTLKHDITALMATAQAERIASDSVHARDAREILAQSVVIVATWDTLATRTKERDRRVTKSKAAVIGSVLLASGVAVGRFALRGKR